MSTTSVPPRKQPWALTPSWSGLFFLVFCWLVYWCFSPPADHVTAPTAHGNVTVVLSDRYPYWTIITSTIVAGVIWLVAMALWIERRDQTYSAQLRKYQLATAPATSLSGGDETGRKIPAPLSATSLSPEPGQELLTDLVILDRVDQLRELARLLATLTARAAVDGASVDGARPEVDTENDLFHDLRLSLTALLVLVADRDRGICHHDAVFVHLTIGDLMPAAADPTTAREFLNHLIDRPDAPSVDEELANWTACIEECALYNRVAADAEAITASEALLKLLTNQFRRPWPVGHADTALTERDAKARPRPSPRHALCED